MAAMQDLSPTGKHFHVEEMARVSTGRSGSTADLVDKEKDLEIPIVDSEPETRMTFKKLLPLIAMAFLLNDRGLTSRAHADLTVTVYQDIGGVDRWIWFVLANLLALASVCPCVGSLSDLFGRRYVAMMGASFLIIGMIVCSTAHTMNIFIAGMSIAGVGAGINELTALAVTSEIAPTRKRGFYNCLMVLTIVPTWRYVGLFCGLWAFVGLVLTAVFYHPPPRVNSEGLSRGAVAKRIDYVGGLLSISGMLLFMMGLQWGSYGYTWTSVHALVPLFIGVALLALFFVWEFFFAKFPMFPRTIIASEPRILGLTLVITTISGANFFSVLLFFPTQSYNVFGHDPVGIGLRTLPLGFSILAGACIVLALLSFTGGHIRELMLGSCIFMTAGTASLAALDVDNVSIAYGLLVIAGLGIGGIGMAPDSNVVYITLIMHFCSVVPASIITTIICPPEIIATVTALTLAIRVIGGALGYCIYYSIFAQKFTHFLTDVYVVPTTLEVIDKTIGKAAIEKTVTQVAGLTVAGLLPPIRELPGITSDLAYDKIVLAGREAYAHSYPYVYYVSLAFGIISIICSLFLGNIKKHMNNSIAAAYA
ncbi:MAG: hypothetical protein M1828_000474 [Chrysothrix sp. TS-e1954]|nr:MAG: hypothetical protein M1828_000474 [Chrysothrix sp. TS-e1954]